MENLNRIKEAFEANPKVTQFVVTSDGQCFLKASDAKNHSRTLGDYKTEIYSRERLADELKPKSENSDAGTAKPSAEERAEAVAQVETLDELEALKEGEKAKTVLAAIEAREVELKEALKYSEHTEDANASDDENNAQSGQGNDDQTPEAGSEDSSEEKENKE